MLTAHAFMKWVYTLVAVAVASKLDLSPRQESQIPSFVIDFAPLVFLDVNEYYLPSDINAQITNTFPALNFTKITSGPADLSVADLSSINQAGNCSFSHINSCAIYLTNQDETAYPLFLNGTLPNPDTGETEGAKSCAIIVNDHGDGIVDAYYMYFYAFNLGYVVLGTLLGNHVGDWEHTMTRFVNGKPDTVWFSQHDSGEVYTYDSLSKRNGRPIVYSAIGTHANYAVPGRHSRKVVVVTINDQTSAGPLWDPIQSAYFYTFTPSDPATFSNSGTFESATPPNSSLSNGSSPVDWLLFDGKWGNKQLPDSNPKQTNFADLNIAWTWESGPTGPYDKDLNRNGTCPDSQVCTTLRALPSVSGDPMPSQTIIRSSTTSTPSSSPSTTSTGGGGGGAGSDPGGAISLGVGRTAWIMCFASLLFGLGMQI